MNVRMALMLLCMVNCAALAPAEFCVSHCKPQHVQDVNEAWVTLNSTFLHVATFAMGWIFSKLFKEGPVLVRKPRRTKTLAHSAASPDVRRTKCLEEEYEEQEEVTAKPTIADNGIDIDEYREVAKARRLGATARNLADIFKQELDEETERIEYEVQKVASNLKVTASGLAKIFQQELLDGEPEHSDDDLDDSCVHSGLPSAVCKQEVSDAEPKLFDDEMDSSCLPTRSPTNSWGPPSPPSPSLVASPMEEMEVSRGISFEEIDVDGLILLRAVEASLAIRTRPNEASTKLPPWRRSSSLKEPVANDESIFVFLSRVYRSFQCSNPCFVIALIYMDRLSEVSPSYLAVTERTFKKIFATCLVLALKFHDDDYRPYTNAVYAESAGLGAAELNDMERQFCRLLSWKFSVQLSEYNLYHKSVSNAAASP